MRKSWYFTPDVALAIGPGSFRELYRILLNPPLRFVLTFVDEREANHLQCCLVNDNAVIRKDTGLKFTINNVPFAYTIYELQEAIRHGPEGKAAGVQELLKMHHPGESFLEDGEVSVKRGRGRPPKVDEEDSRVLHKVVRRSGYETHTTRA